MNDLSMPRLWGMRAAFALVVMLILFFHLLPLETTPRRWAGPDLLLAFACAWSLRRPEYVPAGILAILFLLSDMLLQRPPGLWAVLALIGCENLKGRARGLRDGSFTTEWLTVSLILIAIALANRVLLMVFFVPLPNFGLVVFQLAMTLILYPFVVAVSHWGMGVRKSAPGDLDARGGRL